MEEQFVLRVPPSIAEKLESLLNDNADEDSIDLAFNSDGRTGKFTIGQDEFDLSLVDLPCVVESYKSYDDSVLIKTADIGQMILVNDPANPSKPDVTNSEYKHGLTPAMKNARKRWFRRQPDMDPEKVSKVEEDLTNIMAGGTARDVDVEVLEQEEEVEEEVVQKKPVPEPVPNGSTDKNKTSNSKADVDGSSSSDDGDYDDDSEN